MLPRMRWFLSALVLLVGLVASTAPAPIPDPPMPAVPAGQVVVLGGKQPLRFFVHWRWIARGTAATAKETPGSNFQRWVLNAYAAPTPLPDPAWASADFDDVSWNRQAGPLFGWMGHAKNSDLGLLCARARFNVDDPAKAADLALQLAYRGGAVVYLNGVEVARGHLPAGKIELLTLAEDYAAEVFALPAPRDDVPVKGQEAAYLARVRTLTAQLPARLLRKGTNVLAIELHRTAVPDGLDARNLWATAGLVTLQVTAPEGAGARGATVPTNPYVWNVDPFVRAGVDETPGNPLEPLRPITITGPRNGIVNGQVAVTLPAAGPGCAATVSDLAFGGNTISGAAVTIRYAQPGAALPALLDKPAAIGAVHPIWLTVAIPKAAQPGVYRGVLTIATPGAPTRVPVELTVTALTLPDRAEWKTDVCFLQSPEAVAGYYKVPLWSDEHFAHLDKSLAMLAHAGTNALSIGALAEDIFGADPSILFVKQGDAWVPDLRYAERYLMTYAKHGPAPRFVNLQCWNYSVSGTGNRRDSGGGRKWLADTLKVFTLQDGKMVKVEMPGYTKPGSEETWRLTLAGVRDILKKLGWTRTEVILGTSGDDWPVPEIIAQFKAIDPALRWRVATHGSSVSKWGATDAERTQANGMIVGWANMVRRITTTRRSLSGENAAFSVIKRDSVSDAPSDYFTLAPLAWAAGYSGITNRPFDYWTYTNAAGKAISPLSVYVSFGNITSHGPRAFVVAGPDGPMPTPQLELVREGVQVNEAVIVIERTLADEAKAARVSKAVTEGARQAISDLQNALEASRRFYPAGGTDVRRQVTRLYTIAGEVARQAGL